MKTMLEEREKKKFTDFKDLQERVGLKEPAKQIAKRIIEEITGETRMSLFVRK
jgi:putative nucleotide binding protein